MTKVCRDCGVEKPLDQFNKNGKNRSGVRAYCKLCDVKRALAWRAAHPEVKRKRTTAGAQRQDERRVEREFGLSPDGYNEMNAAQDGLCAICSEPCKTYKRLSVDHNHLTGVIRDLVCRRCNLILGHASDDPELLIKAAKYLKKHTRRVRMLKQPDMEGVLV